MAQKLRDTMWGLNMEGITMPTQQEQTKLYRWSEIPHEWASRAILVMVDESVNHNPLLTRGRHTPYYGSATKMRVRRAPMQVLEVGNIVSSLKQLMEIKGWVKGDAEITRLIESLIQEKTTVPLEALELYTRQVYSGAISHRLPCQALKRGGMTNQNLNFSSHIRILSDTALHYAKSGTNYTICFQSAFLYAISTLAQYQEMGIEIAGKWGLVFHKPCCVKEIPTEQFTLDRSEYEGVALQNRIDRLRPKYEVARTVQDSVVDGETSYSVIMARKFTLWIRNIELSTRISTLENRAIHESLTAPFVNLTEFVHLNCRQFFMSLIYYNFLYSKDTRRNPQTMWEPMMMGGALKSAYDVLCDSLIKCNLLRPWMEITGRKLHAGSTREGLRGLLVQTLSTLCEPGWKQIVMNHTILTHEDSEAIYIAASRLLTLFSGCTRVRQ
ncbi:RNA-dependent RNA polymerase, partial [Thalictrum thalictroides]